MIETKEFRLADLPGVLGKAGERLENFLSTVREKLMIARANAQHGGDLLQEPAFQRMKYKGNFICQHLDRFQNISRQKVAAVVMEDSSDLIFKHSGYFFTQDEQTKLDKKWLVEELVKNGHAQLVFANFSFFEDLDRQKLARSLAKQQHADVILRQLTIFPDVDQAWLFGQLCDQGYQNLAIGWRGKFNQLSDEQIALQLLQSGEGVVILGQSQQLPTLKKEWLLEQFLSSSSACLIPKYIRFFRTNQLNEQLLVQTLLSKGLGQEVLEHRYLFRAVDFRLIKMNELRSSTPEVAAQFLPFLGRDTQVEVLHTLAGASPESAVKMNMVHYLDKLNEYDKAVFDSYGSSSEVIDFSPYLSDYHNTDASVFDNVSEDERQELLIFSFQHSFFRACVLLVRRYGYSSVMFGQLLGVDAATLRQQVMKSLDVLRSEGNTRHWADLLDLGRTLFPEDTYGPLSNDIEPVVQSSEQNLTNRQPYSYLDCQREIFEYYLSISLTRGLQGKLTEELPREFYSPVMSLFHKFREYLLLAVCHELSNVRSGKCLGPIQGAGYASIYQFDTPENVRLFFDRASVVFRDGQSLGVSYAGESWSQIALVAKEFWKGGVEQDLNEMNRLVNLSISLQHNNGFVFDKDPKRTFLIQPVLQDLLNFEAAGNRSYSDFLKYGLAKKLISPEKVALSENRLLWVKNHSAQLLGAATDQSDAARFVHSLRTQRQETVQKSATSFSSSTTEIMRELDRMSEDDLPADVRKSIHQHYSNETGFISGQDGPVLMGNFLSTLKLFNGVEKDEKTYQSFTSDNQSNRLILISINGYHLGYWYQNGELVQTTTAIQFYAKMHRLAELLSQPIVAAQFHSLREGD